MTKNYEQVASWRRRTKVSLIEKKGGKCEKCGYDKVQYPRAFDFHHIDPNQKDFSLGSKNWAIEQLLQELEKCQLLCKNCHAEVHEEIDTQRRSIRTKLVKKRLQGRKCGYCKNSFKPSREDQKYCTIECFDFSKRKVDRPSKEKLEKMVWEKPTSQIAFDFGVSDNAVGKWCKLYGIVKPKRGYWQRKIGV